MTDEERLDLLLQVVVLMHNALDWSDKRYAAVHGARIRERLEPLVDEWQGRIAQTTRDVVMTPPSILE